MPTLTAPDGTLLAYDMYEAAAPRAAVLALHGWADHAGRWRDVGERLCAAGYSSYLLDLRGHGRSGGRRGHLSRFSQLLGDLQAFRRVVRLRTDRPQLLLGTSFGGLVALRRLETLRRPRVCRSVAHAPGPRPAGCRHAQSRPGGERRLRGGSVGARPDDPRCLARDPVGAARRAGGRLPHRIPGPVPTRGRGPCGRCAPGARLRRQPERPRAGPLVSRDVSRGVARPAARHRVRRRRGLRRRPAVTTAPARSTGPTRAAIFLSDRSFRARTPTRPAKTAHLGRHTDCS